jgi:hypothetical protein
LETLKPINYETLLFALVPTQLTFHKYQYRVITRCAPIKNDKCNKRF